MGGRPGDLRPVGTYFVRCLPTRGARVGLLLDPARVKLALQVTNGMTGSYFKQRY